MKRTILTLCLAIFCLISKGQTNYSWEKLYETFLEETDDDERSASWEELYEELEELHAQPLNINTATQEQLSRLPFLTNIQIEHIHAYIYRTGGMKSLGELLLIPQLDASTRALLRQFIYVGDAEEREEENKFSAKRLIQYGRHEVITRLDIPLYQKAGYRNYTREELSGSPNKQYLGEPFYHSLRYNYKYLNHVTTGFTLEKDAGEPLFSQGFNGYDHYSLYLMLNDFGWLKSLIIGDYRLKFGRGVVMNTDFNLGKSATLTTMGWGKRGIKKHSSTSEHNAFRGVAATVRLWERWEATGFFSLRNVDANLNEKRLITSFKTDGLHRTPLEYSKKGNTRNTLFGGNLTYHYKGFHGGITAVHNLFNRVLKPGQQLYKRYHPRGDRFFTIGTDYMYLSHRVSIAGETALSKSGGIGTLNQLQFRIGDDNLLTLVQRYYSRSFVSLNGNSFSTNSTLQNESGIYLGFDTPLHPHWHLSAYADFCYFPWLKYQVSNASFAGEAMIHITYSRSDNHKLSLRYRCRIKERDYTAANGRKYLATQVHHRLRHQQDYQLSVSLSATSLADYNLLQFMNSISQGFMITQRLQWKPVHKKVSLLGGLSYFHTDNYSTRISIYERSLLYTFSYPSYYGHGIHISATTQWNISTRLSALFHLTHTCYFDRSAIGTGTEEILQSHREDVRLQLRWKI